MFVHTHMHRHVRRQVYGNMPRIVCRPVYWHVCRHFIDMNMGVCIDMCTGMCIDIGVGMCVGTSIGICTYMGVGMCIDVS